MFRCSCRTAQVIFFGQMFAFQALAGVAVGGVTPAGWFTDQQISGTGANEGDIITVTLSSGKKITTFVQKDLTWKVNGPFPKGKTKVEESDDESTTVTVSLVFTPPSNAVQTSFAVSSGSSALVGGHEFALSGSFTTFDTFVDYDPLSPTFGQFSGSVLESLFNVSGTGVAGSIAVLLNGNQPYSENMIPVWTAATVTGGVAIPLTVPLTGTLSFNGLTSPFTGTATGTDIFFPDSIDTVNLTFDLASEFGPVTGTFNATGIEKLVPLPEPSSLTLLAIGIATVAYRIRARNAPNRYGSACHTRE